MGESHRKLIVWQRSVQLAIAIYGYTSKFPSEERFGLTNQLRRAGVSIASNIAEGYGRGTKREYKQFLAIARGSTLEVQTQVLIAQKLGFGDIADHGEVEGLSEEVSKMLYSLMNKL